MRTVVLPGVKRIQGLHFTPDGEKLVIASGREVYGMDLGIWFDLTTDTEIARFPGGGGPYTVPKDLEEVVTTHKKGTHDSFDRVFGKEPNWEGRLATGGTTAFFMARAKTVRIFGVTLDAKEKLLFVSQVTDLGDEEPDLGCQLYTIKRYIGMFLEKSFDEAGEFRVMQASPDGLWLAVTEG
ncbi:MAG: hypothetical protein ACRC8S_02985 [Fimbriiglobus sp.]